MSETGSITREYALSRSKKLRGMAKMMDGHRDCPNHNKDQPESMAQLLRQAAFVIEMTAPKQPLVHLLQAETDLCLVKERR